LETGSNQLVSLLAEELQTEGKKPYCIPVGGSNVQVRDELAAPPDPPPPSLHPPQGTFGYLQAVQEIISSYCQCGLPTCQCACPYQHIVFACGSGGTAAGLAIGMRLAGISSQVLVLPFLFVTQFL
jgi:D-cysteine desulfhydrase